MTLIYDSSTPYDSATLYEGGSSTLRLIFTPPLVKDRPPILPEPHPGNELWLHYENRYRGVNVWILSDGSVVQDTATPENSNTDMSAVYPWDVNNAAAPYVTSVFIDSGADPQVASVHTVRHNPYPIANFYGGSSHVVTPVQSTLLANYTAHGIGYSDCLTPES